MIGRNVLTPVVTVRARGSVLRLLGCPKRKLAAKIRTSARATGWSLQRPENDKEMSEL